MSAESRDKKVVSLLRSKSRDVIVMCRLKGEFTFFFFIRELDVAPLGESNLMGPKKSIEVKFFMVAFFGCTQVPNVIDNARCTDLP